jgi:hypothetical protein
MSSESSFVDTLANGADLILCDVSGVLTDSLTLDVPILVYENSHIAVKSATSLFPREQFSYVYHSLPDLAKTLDRLLHEGDYLAEQRHMAIQYFSGKEETMNDSFSHELHRVAASSESLLSSVQS